MVLWVFGYASLLWKTGFEYDERIVGFIKGYRRVFHLACYDHRGTPELPARVPTLESDEDAVCWGVAYRITSAEACRKVLAYLDVRECEYDLRSSFAFFTEESPSKPVVPEVVVFMSTPDRVNNKYYLGAAPREEMALQIAMASGVSGRNCDYLFHLVDALSGIGHEDKEVIELANAVRKILSELKVSRSYNSLMGGANLSLGPLPSPIHSSASQLPQLTTIVPMSGLSHMSVNCTPCSPRLVRSEAI